MTGVGHGDAALHRALERMAHQIKNPLQALGANLEVIRSRVRKEAPGTWESLERFGRAVDTNVAVLDRRLRLLLALGRRHEDDHVVSDVDLAGLARDFAAALRYDAEPPGVEVDGETGLAARARPGWLLALLLELWEAAAAAGAEATPVTVRGRTGRVVAEMPLPRAALHGSGGEPALPPGWEEAAERAGGGLALAPAEDEGDARVALTLPTG